MPNAVIVDAVRTPMGRRNGKLSGWHPVDLAAETLKALVQRNDVDPALIEDVVMGCVTQVGAQGGCIARAATFAAGFPESVTGTTVDRQCGSSQQAAHFAAHGVMAGAYDVAIAAGVEVMSLVPMGANVALPDYGMAWGPTVMKRYEPAGGLVSQGVAAERIAEQWGLSREDLDAFGARSHQLGAAATAEGRFEREIIPVESRVLGQDSPGEAVTADEGIRPETTVETLAKLKPAFMENGKVTAGNSSQISDGASAVLIMSEERASSLGLTPKARFHSFALAGTDPIMMATAPIPATRKVLERAKLGIDDIDVVEISEAFASVVLAWRHELGADLARVNPNGGAIGLGHPLGCSGTRLLTTLVYELERTGGRFGLETMCEGGGMANALVIERLG